MIQTVVKRDGRIVGFNEQKIVAAIRKAMLTTEEGEDEALITQIADRISMKGRSQMSVEEIQDMVENELMKSSRKDVARIYIKYRNARSVARKAKTRDIFLEIINIKNNDVTRENANMNADTPAGMMMKFASETTKPFVDDYLLSEDARRTAPPGKDTEERVPGRARGESPRQAYRNGQHTGLHQHGNGTERDARRAGHPGL